MGGGSPGSTPSPNHIRNEFPTADVLQEGSVYARYHAGINPSKWVLSSSFPGR